MAKTNNTIAQAKGQKNLFSFFSKKPSAVTSSKLAAVASASSVKKSSSNAAPAASSKSAQKTNNDTTTSAPAAAPTRPSNGSSKAAPTSAQLKQLQKITVGTKLAVYWPDDEEYYPCVVTRHRIRAEGDPGTYIILTLLVACLYIVHYGNVHKMFISVYNVVQLFTAL